MNYYNLMNVYRKRLDFHEDSFIQDANIYDTWHISLELNQ